MRQEGYYPLAANIGYLLLKVPQDILGELKMSVNDVQKDFTQAIDLSKSLAGQIDKEYQINLTHKTNQYIKWTAEEYGRLNHAYIRNLGQLFGKAPVLNYNGEAWVNFQEKYEYNPLHNHSGVLSFVMWYQIPYYKEDEIKKGPGKGKGENNLNGEFEFIFYNGESVKEESLGIDKKMEGYMAVFPSLLHHIVYPFYTSDDYRITISGNIHLQ